MTTWKVTADDRDPAGRIKVNTFDDEVARALRDVGLDMGEPPAPEGATPAAPIVRRWERDAAMLMCGLLVGVLLFALLGRSREAPAAPRAPLAPPTAAPTITIAPSATPAPTATLEPTATEEPTDAPALFAPPPSPCDPLTAPYQVKQQVFPIGSVVGISCSSAGEALSNAASLAATMIADATAHPPPTPATR
jgi:hypothetical protein